MRVPRCKLLFLLLSNPISFSRRENVGWQKRLFGDIHSSYKMANSEIGPGQWSEASRFQISRKYRMTNDNRRLSGREPQGFPSRTSPSNGLISQTEKLYSLNRENHSSYPPPSVIPHDTVFLIFGYRSLWGAYTGAEIDGRGVVPSSTMLPCCFISICSLLVHVRLPRDERPSWF